MEKHRNLTDHEFKSQFANGSMDPSVFSHEAHLRLAWIHISKYGVEKAIENCCSQIKTFAESQGDYGKFNVTVSVAAVRAVYHFVLKSKAPNFNDFIAEFPRLKNKFKELIDAHYTLDIFKSELTKYEFVEPDIIPFDAFPKDEK